MYGLNIDPRNPQGDPVPKELRALGVRTVRFTFKDPAPGGRPDQDAVGFYRRQVEALAEAGIHSLVVLTRLLALVGPVSELGDDDAAETKIGR